MLNDVTNSNLMTLTTLKRDAWIADAKQQKPGCFFDAWM
jgi:hypothetical protein